MCMLSFALQWIKLLKSIVCSFQCACCYSHTSFTVTPFNYIMWVLRGHMWSLILSALFKAALLALPIMSTHEAMSAEWLHTCLSQTKKRTSLGGTSGTFDLHTSQLRTGCGMGRMSPGEWSIIPMLKFVNRTSSRSKAKINQT